MPRLILALDIDGVLQREGCPPQEGTESAAGAGAAPARAAARRRTSPVETESSLISASYRAQRILMMLTAALNVSAVSAGTFTPGVIQGIMEAEEKRRVEQQQEREHQLRMELLRAQTEEVRARTKALAQPTGSSAAEDRLRRLEALMKRARIRIIPVDDGQKMCLSRPAEDGKTAEFCEY